MVNWIINKYQRIVNSNSTLNRLRVYSLIRFTLRLLANIVIPIYYSLTLSMFKNKYIIHEIISKTDKKFDSYRVIVSLTSFPARIGRVWLVIESILRQEIKPDKVILYLSGQQFKSTNELPRKLKKQMQRGLEIVFVDEDIKSHKKYYYAFKSYSEDIIITIDDDVFYPSDFIRNLLYYSQKYKNCIIANVAKRVIHSNNKIDDYSKWPIAEINSISNYNFLVGIGGVLYPPKVLHPLWSRKDLFMSLCPLADDIWLNAMAYLANTPIFKTDSSIAMLPIINYHPQNLHSANVSENKNNIQIANLYNYISDNLGIVLFEENK